MRARILRCVLVVGAAALLLSPGLPSGFPVVPDLAGAYRIQVIDDRGNPQVTWLELRRDGTAESFMASAAVITDRQGRSRVIAFPFPEAGEIRWRGTWRRRGGGADVTIIVPGAVTARWRFRMRWHGSRRRIFSTRAEMLRPWRIAGLFVGRDGPGHDERVWFDAVPGGIEVRLPTERVGLRFARELASIRR